MKKVYTAALLLLSILCLRTAAFADAAPIPRFYRLNQALESPLVPLIIAIVIIAVVILVKVLRRKK